MGMGQPAFGIISLAVTAVALVWVNEKSATAPKFAKFAAWFSVLAAFLLVIGQMAMCAKACISGQCMREGKFHGMMMPQMMHNMPETEEK